MERFAADLDGLVEQLEAERAERVDEWPRVADAQVQATEVRPHAEVVTLDVEQRSRLHAARALAGAGGEPAPVHERPLAGRERMAGRVPRPSRDDGVGPLERGRDVSPLGDDRTPDDGAGPVAHRSHRVGAKAQPRVQYRGGLRRVELVPQSSESFGVLVPRTLDAEGMNGRGKHRLADERVVDEEQQVRRESVEVTRARPPCFVLKMTPRGGAQLAEPLRFEGAQPRGHGGLHRIVEPQPFRRLVDEAERAESLHRIVRVVARHRVEDTSRHASGH